MKLFDIQKYLRKNPPQEGKIFRSCDGFFTFAVVVPMLYENSNAEKFFGNLCSVLKKSSENIIIIAVVNCAENSPLHFKEDNQKLLSRLLHNEFAIPNLAVIDCTSPGRCLKNGVGEARKNGMDYALTLFDCADFENSIIASLDADTEIEEDYFKKIRAGFIQYPQTGVLTFDVQHIMDAENPAAIAQYELYLKSYRDGLEYAGSPYAFYTVGSAFATRASSYIQSGGMRKLKAGEDFYFLQSAVKSSKVSHYPQVTVHPSARNSARVPFGTGTALQSITANEKDFTPFPQYAFDALKKILDAAETENLRDPETFFAAIPPELHSFFIDANFAADWKKVIANMPTSQLRNAFVLHWFDGLKTLQFLKFAAAR